MRLRTFGGSVAALAVAVLVSIPTSARAGGIKKRAENQQDRIAQGIKSGQLTAGEAANLEHKEAALNREVGKDRAAKGGKLTAQERAQVNRQQNHLSNQIYNKKHNGRKQ